MKTLAKLPPWARTALLGVNLLAALGVLVTYWIASYPNLIASWAQGSVLMTLVPLARAWLERRLAEHHDAVKEHVDRALAAPAPQDGGQQ